MFDLLENGYGWDTNLAVSGCWVVLPLLFGDGCVSYGDLEQYSSDDKKN